MYRGETKMGILAQYSRSEDLKQTADLLVSIRYGLKLQQSYRFRPLPNQMQMPSLESVNNFLFGKLKTDKFSSQRFNTKLAGRRRRRPESFIDLKAEYKKFLLTKNLNVICDQKRFEELCVEKKNGRANGDSIDKALSILEAEEQGFVNNMIQPKPSEVDADFKIEGPGPYNVADVKISINWGKGNANLKVAAERMGRKIVKQRLRM